MHVEVSIGSGGGALLSGGATTEQDRQRQHGAGRTQESNHRKLSQRDAAGSSRCMVSRKCTLSGCVTSALRHTRVAAFLSPITHNTSPRCAATSASG